MMHIWTWILNFTGINDGANSFANHMYNFWSGIGSDLTEFALFGAALALYRKHIKTSKLLNSHLLDALHNSTIHFKKEDPEK